ncbi:MAG: hypothetical protein JWR12_2415 [Mucilaginibacter sp.]|nr:hypothetical protein [Mucilaginibacter sp.]
MLFLLKMQLFEAENGFMNNNEGVYLWLILNENTL